MIKSFSNKFEKDCFEQNILPNLDVSDLRGKDLICFCKPKRCHCDAILRKANNMYNEFWHGDCLELMKDIPDGSIDMILCDLPYGTTSCAWDTIIPFEPLWEQYWRITKPNSAIVLTASQPFTTALISSQIKYFKHEWIWHKSKSGSAFTAKYRPLNRHESVLVFGKGKVTYNPQMREGTPYTRTRKAKIETDPNNHKLGLGNKENMTINSGYRYPESVIPFQQKWRRQDQLHPTQKPVPLFEYLIKTYTNPGETILDNCAGSGTTAIAAINTGRNWICIEQDEEYYNKAGDRIEKHLESLSK